MALSVRTPDGKSPCGAAGSRPAASRARVFATRAWPQTRVMRSGRSGAIRSRSHRSRNGGAASEIDDAPARLGAEVGADRLDPAPSCDQAACLARILHAEEAAVAEQDGLPTGCISGRLGRCV